MTRAEKAVEKNKEGYNCAQSVLYAFAADCGLDAETGMALSTGFGAGIGRTQGICGAASGAVMALGLKYGKRNDTEGREKIEDCYNRVQEFLRAFAAEAGSTQCRELLSGCDLSTEEGKAYFKEHNLKETCLSCIRLSCDLAQEAMEEK
ncbi:C-GCAxxG-C-C family protein [Breznakiella homolactica]|uniref:C_GCAxxG_C_C family protein n=1 Tax=Breznakiella homolactica TaxID=2798577 RepID=A0A7T7XNJ8_9SPIR|nr:C-GCAxxG-C-C family protein [Breznakiella homolactica]QQO09625.1 C-GCAxxG-C-C family protein [Breznakiella homolactica]